MAVRTFLCIMLLLSGFASAHAAVTMAVSQQSGTTVRERADQLATQLGRGLGTTVNVVVLPDAAEVEAWLNRYATAELALVEAGYAAGKPGQFVVIGPVGELTLIGRQGISGDLPQRIAEVLAGGGGRQPAGKAPAASPAVGTERPRETSATVVRYSASKSVEEDRYFVIQVYREKLHREPDPEGLEYWVKQLQSGAMTKRQLFDTICDPGTKGCGFK
ncbi:MAG: DUF4214 domain-containing protein [Desulfuromonadales bacterium]|nr:DUF4214 domain-containing protein [Desulfuromonadales bacterium]